MTRPAPEVVFLDIDDTLFGTSDFVARARAAAVDAMLARGLNAGRTLVMEELAGVVAEFGSNDDRHYDRLLLRLPTSATRETNRDLLVVAGVIAYHNAKWEHLRIAEGADALLRDLKLAGIRLGVITSGLARKQMEKLLRLGLDRWIDPPLIYITDSVGIAKSNPLLYSRCAEKSGVAPERAMHVGDHPLHDIDSANRAGLTTVWRRGGRHATVEPPTPPHHVIDEITDLRGLLRGEYGVDLPE